MGQKYTLHEKQYLHSLSDRLSFKFLSREFPLELKKSAQSFSKTTVEGTKAPRFNSTHQTV